MNLSAFIIIAKAKKNLNGIGAGGKWSNNFLEYFWKLNKGKENFVVHCSSAHLYIFLPFFERSIASLDCKLSIDTTRKTHSCTNLPILRIFSVQKIFFPFSSLPIWWCRKAIQFLKLSVSNWQLFSSDHKDNIESFISSISFSLHTAHANQHVPSIKIIFKIIFFSFAANGNNTYNLDIFQGAPQQELALRSQHT